VERSQATFEAYDGVELKLQDGRSVLVPSFTVTEAVHYLRILDRVREGSFDAHVAFLAGFPARVGILEVPLPAFGFEVGIPGAGIRSPDLTVAQAVALADTVALAQETDGWRAQAEVLGRIPAVLGLDGAAPAEVFLAARLFAHEVYTLLYGLAESFFGHLVSIPRGQVLTMGTAALTSTPGSTT
jgi:hypothetical protein